MRKLIQILIIIFLFQYSYAQKQNCGWFGTTKSIERLKQFPFNRAKRIVLVSYPASIDLQYKNQVTPVYLKTLNVSFGNSANEYKITEEKEIQGKDVDDLSNLLINYTLRKGYKSNIYESINCYSPRNGVVFYDKNEKIICFLEICFECMQYYITPQTGRINDLNHVENCGRDRIEYLREIFKRNGLYFGKFD